MLFPHGALHESSGSPPSIACKACYGLKGGRNTAGEAPRVSPPQYKCQKCPGYCCSYPLIPLDKRDVERLARHHQLSFEDAKRAFTKEEHGRKYAMRRKRDDVFGKICRFFDTTKRCCTIYEARPAVCRGISSCSTTCPRCPSGRPEFASSLPARATSQDPDRSEDHSARPVGSCLAARLPRGPRKNNRDGGCRHPLRRQGRPAATRAPVLAAGRPTVMFHLPGIEDVIATGSNGIIVPQDDWQGLIDALASVLADSGLRQALAAGPAGPTSGSGTPRPWRPRPSTSTAGSVAPGSGAACRRGELNGAYGTNRRRPRTGADRVLRPARVGKTTIAREVHSLLAPRDQTSHLRP